MGTTGLIKALLLAGAMTLAAGPMTAQAQQRPGAYKAPRTAFGTPDLQGTWTNVTVTPLERPAAYGARQVLTPEEVARLEGAAIAKVDYENLPTDPKLGPEDHTNKNCGGAGGRDCGYNAGWKDSTIRVMRVGGEPRTSFITTTPNGRIPPRIQAAATGAQRTLDARERQQAAGEGGSAGRNDNPEGRGLAERCLAFGNTAGPLLQNGYYNNNIRITQAKDAVAIELEMVHDVRVVRLNEKHRTDGVRPYFGDSIGWWAGDTLVVETTNYHPSTSFRGSSANLKMTEKFTRVGRDRLLYQFTVEDPTVWATPWGGEYEFYPTEGGMYEYACHEGNYGLEGILAGARNEEQQAAAATGSTARR